MTISSTVRAGLTGPVKPLSSHPLHAESNGLEDLDLSLGPTSAPAAPTAVLAHRGASGLFPEHTRAAYLRALDEGADGLEIDLHLTRDGEPVCFHDPTLERTTDGTGSVAETTLAQMRRLDATGWKTPKLPAEYGRAEQQLMTLQDVLELLQSAGRDLKLAIELKHPSPFGHRLEDRVLQVLTSFGWDPETSLVPAGAHQVAVSFMSFYPGSLNHLAEVVPGEHLCALFTTVTDADVAQRLAKLRFSSAVKHVVAAVMRSSVRDSEALVWNSAVGLAGPGVEYVQANLADAKAWIARGTRLRVWTVDSPHQAQMLLNLGVQEITTNYPARILRQISR